MKHHPVYLAALQAMGREYAAGHLPCQPSLFRPQPVDDELREHSPLSAAHYDRLNGVRSFAESYFAAVLYDESDRRVHRDHLVDMLDAMRWSTNSTPITAEAEQWIADDDVALMRSMVAAVTERLLETMRGLNDDLSTSDLVCLLIAELELTVELLTMALSNALSREEVAA